jgi:hypothetical protein
MDEAGAALDRLTPHVAVTYAEAGGWGRALVLEARRRGLPTAALQHGFIYRHWLNYLHEADEILPDGSDRGFPLPDRTLLFDRYAAEQLERTGHFPGSTLRVTGSPRLDELAAKVAALRPHRDDIRREYAVGDDQQLVVLAAKFTEIADALPSVLAAVAVRPDVRLVVKAHPAEVPEVYAPFLKTVQNASTAPADADLARLLAAADGLMTMNSTVAIDCLLLGVPALVLAEPNNLTPFVEAGLMLGAGDRPIADLLGRLLDDLPAREELRRRSMVFTDRFEIRADGLAADRAANEILALAR